MAKEVITGVASNLPKSTNSNEAGIKSSVKSKGDTVSGITGKKVTPHAPNRHPTSAEKAPKKSKR